ncbi:MAG: TadE/TadG family type IV pilus assembly protein [Janthinobacterium lividum]
MLGGGRRRGLLNVLRGRATGDDRGTAAIEMAFIAPVFLLVVFLGIQLGLWAYGRSVALQSAREGVAQMRVLADRAQVDAAQPGIELHVQQFATSIGRESLLEPRVSTSWSPDGERVSVQVSGRVISLVPGLDLHTTQQANGSVERFGNTR